MGKDFLPRFPIREDFSSLGKNILPLRRNGEGFSSPFPHKGRFFFPREEYSSLKEKWGRIFFPVSPKGKGFPSPGKIFVPLRQNWSSILCLRRSREGYSCQFPLKGRFFFPREEYHSLKEKWGEIFLPVSP